MALDYELSKISELACRVAVERLAREGHFRLLTEMGVASPDTVALTDEFPALNTSVDIVADQVQRDNPRMTAQELQAFTGGLEIGYIVLHEIIRMQRGEVTPG